MELKVIKQEKDKLILQLKGEDHTLANALKTELLNDKDITIVGYSVDHPNIGTPRLVIEGKEPKKALQEAIKRLKKEAEKIKKSLEKEIK